MLRLIWDVTVCLFLIQQDARVMCVYTFYLFHIKLSKNVSEYIFLHIFLHFHAKYIICFALYIFSRKYGAYSRTWFHKGLSHVLRSTFQKALVRFIWSLYLLIQPDKVPVTIVHRLFLHTVQKTFIPPAKSFV